MARADGSLRNLLARLSRIDVLVIDDWAMAPLSEPERRDFWEICEDRYQVRSTILTSQLPVSRWHEQIGDPTVADGILDRLVHNAIASSCVGIPCVSLGATSRSAEVLGTPRLLLLFSMRAICSGLIGVCLLTLPGSPGRHRRSDG